MSKSQATLTGFDPAGPFAGLVLPDRFRKRQSETRFKQRWTLTLEQYWAMMAERYEMRSKRWIPLRRWQKGFICAASANAVPQGGSVNLTAHSITDSRVGAGTARATIRYGTDGGLDGLRLFGSDSTFSGEWWSDEPETDIGDTHEVRSLSAGKSGTFSTSAAADNTWITITTDRDWTKETTGLLTTVSATQEVGEDGVESALDSATITLAAEVDDS